VETRSQKADLHVHSKYSKRPSEWILRKIGCAESYTEPLDLYDLARGKGMDLVTITDHNTLSGSLDIAHLPDTFVSEEVTAYFPEDGCKLHVLVYDIDEKHHRQISRLRENVLDLAKYLCQEKIAYALAHPLYAVNDKLTAEHVEKTFLLFRVFELNGTRLEDDNVILRQVLNRITKEDIEFLADKHDLEPLHSEPWRKTVIGGSDDHSSFHVARLYTEVGGAETKEEFLSGLGGSRVTVKGRPCNPRAMAHNIYSVAYRFYSGKFDLRRYLSKELLLRFVDRALIPTSVAEEGLVGRLRNVIGYHRKGTCPKSRPEAMEGILLREARRIIMDDPELSHVLKRPRNETQGLADVWFTFVNRISEKVLKQFADSILEHLSGADLFNIFHTIGSAGSLYTLMAPFFVSYAFYTKQREFTERIKACLKLDERDISVDGLQVAHFTDTFYEINGVALTLKKQVEIAVKNNKQQTVITCGPESPQSGVTNFIPIGACDLPLYPEMKLYYPPLLTMLDYCYEKGFTHIHSATPGPIGLAALAIARILKLPIYGTYHTALPQYVSYLTEDPYMEEIMWKYTLWYYKQMDVVYVPSRATGEELAQKGIPKGKIRFYPRGIDLEAFHPSKRNGFFKNRFNVDGKSLKLLYVGRVSKEKNLPLLADVFRELSRMRGNLHLVVVGSGPYFDEMKTSLSGTPVTFTGYLEGEDLSQAYASSDIFVFPSSTDTFGNVVLEAQASGLPVVVTDGGGPKENMVPDQTGFVVPAGDSRALIDAVLKLVDHPEDLRAAKEKARAYVEKRSFEAAYMQLWDSYRTVAPRRAA